VCHTNCHPAHLRPLSSLPLTFLSVLLRQPRLLPVLGLHVDPLHTFPEGIQLHAGVQGLHRHRRRGEGSDPGHSPRPPTDPPSGTHPLAVDAQQLLAAAVAGGGFAEALVPGRQGLQRASAPWPLILLTATAKDKAGERVAVRQEDNGVHQLCQ